MKSKTKPGTKTLYNNNNNITINVKQKFRNFNTRNKKKWNSGTKQL